jgi:hypothetical protein
MKEFEACSPQGVLHGATFSSARLAGSFYTSYCWLHPLMALICNFWVKFGYQSEV